ACLAAATRRVYHRDAVVGIWSIPAVEHGERPFKRLNIAARLAQVPRRHQQVNLDLARAPLPGVFDEVEIRAGRPGEIVNVLALKGNRFGPIRVRLYRSDVAG